MKSAEIRNRWLDFFESKNSQKLNHTVVPSASLIADAAVADRVAIDGARPKFEAIRSLYIDDAIELARHLHAVRAPWSGDRVDSTAVVWPDECGGVQLPRSAS